MIFKIIFSSILAVASLTLTGCGGGSENSVNKYSIKVQNLTSAQPMSPVAVVLHNSSYSLFSVGSSASLALEKLAEDGDNSSVIGNTNTSIEQTKSSDALLTPSSVQDIEITSQSKYISLATMLVNTNDAFAGLNSYDISTIAVGENVEINVIAYDAGTEKNSETAQTIPGIGGEGFNSLRDDTNSIVRAHSGVISVDDGLNTSGLTSIHKFDNPVVKLTIKRIN